MSSFTYNICTWILSAPDSNLLFVYPVPVRIQLLQKGSDPDLAPNPDPDLDPDPDPDPQHWAHEKLF